MKDKKNTPEKSIPEKQVPEKRVPEKPVHKESNLIIEKSDEAHIYGFKPTVDREDTVPPREEGDGDD